ncbi:MAG: DegT/DnrJ/EryC1/StrS family aminotransferase, partial [Acidimicrobiales bacterium]
FLFCGWVGGGHRDAFRDHLATLGVDTGIHWTPAHTMTLFQPCRRGGLTVTERAAAEVVSLPLHSGMPESVVDRVCDAVESYFA